MTQDAKTPLEAPDTLVELVDYQSGAVVSRVLLKREAGSLTLFAFDAGEGLSEHTTPHDAIVQVLEGTAEVTVAAIRHRVEAGHALHLPADVPHAVFAPERFKMLLTMWRARRSG